MVKGSKSFIDNIDKKQTIQLLRSAHGLYSNIVQAENITSLSQKNTMPILSSTIRYITDNAFGNIAIKANLLSGIFKPIKLYDIKNSYNHVYPNSKIHFVNEDILLPPRFWSELGIVHTHAQIHASIIDKILMTGDTIKTSSKSNPYPDTFVTLNSKFGQRTTYNDIKTGNAMTKDPLKGTIGQLTFDSSNEIHIPNIISDLEGFNQKRLRLLNSRKDDIKYNLSSKEKQHFHATMQESFVVLEDLTKTIMEKHQQIEKYLYTIQALPNFNKGISFINTVHIQSDKPISEKELSFIQKMLPFTNTNVFSNERTLKSFLKQALRVYAEQNKNTIKELKTLKGTHWEISFIDDIQDNIFA